MDKDSSGENQTSSLVEKSKEVSSLEDDKWRTIQRSLEHHRLSKMYNSQKYESELWFAVAEPSNLDKDSETENNENARDDFDDEDTVNFWQNLFDEKENFESNSNVLCSFSERSLANNIIINDLKINTSHKNLSRKPDSNLLEDILSRTLVMGLKNNDDGDDDDVNEDASNLRTLVPKLDLSEMKTYHTTPESNSMTNHLQLIQTESDPLIGSPDMTDDVNKSHCSSPERLESDQNHLNELNENLISKANRDRTSPRKTYFKNNSSRKESNPLPAQNTVTCGLVMTDIIKKDSKDSGFQEVTDSLETVEKAGVHGNGNQNSRLQRKCLYRRISGISKSK